MRAARQHHQPEPDNRPAQQAERELHVQRTEGGVESDRDDFQHAHEVRAAQLGEPEGEVQDHEAEPAHQDEEQHAERREGRGRFGRFGFHELRADAAADNTREVRNGEGAVGERNSAGEFGNWSVEARRVHSLKNSFNSIKKKKQLSSKNILQVSKTACSVQKLL